MLLCLQWNTAGIWKAFAAEIWSFWTIAIVLWSKFFVTSVVVRIAKQNYLFTSLRFVHFRGQDWDFREQSTWREESTSSSACCESRWHVICFLTPTIQIALCNRYPQWTLFHFFAKECNSVAIANMAAHSGGGMASYSAEVREKLSLWDLKDSPLAPLSEKQKNSVSELTTVASDRPLLDEVKLLFTQWLRRIPFKVRAILAKIIY